MESIYQLLHQDLNIERFTLYGIQTFGKVISLYDGDTFDIVFAVPISSFTKERPISKSKKGVCMICPSPDTPIIMRMKCRLDGIDARELKSEGGKEAKSILEGYLLNKILRCEFKGQDKYGRQLIRIFVTINYKEIDLSEHLKIYSQYFCYYDGGKKTFKAHLEV